MFQLHYDVRPIGPLRSPGLFDDLWRSAGSLRYRRSETPYKRVNRAVFHAHFLRSEFLLYTVYSASCLYLLCGKKPVNAENTPRSGGVEVAVTPYLLERPVACYDPRQTSAQL